MANPNPFLNAERFSRIAENPKSLSIFLTIASHETRNYDEIVEDTNLDLAVVAPLVRDLESGKFIEKNPGPLSSKFRLAFNGQLFAEQLKTSYPEIRELLGDACLIKPIKIKRLT